MAEQASREQGSVPPESAQDLLQWLQQADMADTQVVKELEKSLLRRIWLQDLRNRLLLRRYSLAEAFDAPLGAVDPLGGARSEKNVTVNQGASEEVLSNLAAAAGKAGRWATVASALGLTGGAAGLVGLGLALGSSLLAPPTSEAPVQPQSPKVEAQDTTVKVTPEAKPLTLKVDWYYEPDGTSSGDRPVAPPPPEPPGSSGS